MMRSLRSLAALAVAAASLAASNLPAQQKEDAALTRARALLKAHPVIDGHNDLPWEIRINPASRMNVEAYDLRGKVSGQTDLRRLREGHVGGQFWSVYIPGDIRDSGFARVQLEQIDIARRVIAKYPELQLVTTAAGAEQAMRQGRIASFIGMEGGHAIENSLGALRAYYDLGARYMTLTHNVTLDWADAAGDSAKHGGLTPFGTEVVREMNRLGMLVDLSHVSPGTMSDALDASAAPVIFSHSSARAITNVPRNVPDSILARLPRNGGVVMVTFVPGFVSQKLVDAVERVRQQAATLPSDSARARLFREAEATLPKATIADVADHIEHVRKVAGVDHVGLGGDYDGTDQLPVGLQDVSRYPYLFAELIRRGWSDADLAKLANGNILRALRQAEQVAARLQKERTPSVTSIGQ
ncbi:MAG TPA: dipeptidase [Gemmatimonadaceae bacterium]|nr:dipeptidase [Gemmatimonadaceae bacterium]